ncbi:protein kinase family protein [Nocardioides lentus]|uniref:protein kinase family protein n=1 Tax=Nocardioides lentus TaxID=338077 RepID=UPI0031D1E0B7
MQHGVRPGDVLADRYLLVDLLTESGGGRFWRAHDRVLSRHVALHVLAEDDPRADDLLDAARRSATVSDRRLLRVLDAERRDGLCFVVNEWGTGRSLDIILGTEGPLSPRRAAWIVREAAEGLAVTHAAGVSHGHLVPENLLVDRSGAVRLIGFAVDAALRGLDPSPAGDVRGLAGLLYAALTGRWPGPPPSQVPEAPREGVHVLRPRQVRAGIPRALDVVCDELLNPAGTHLGGVDDAARLAAALDEVVGDDNGMVAAEAARHRTATDARGPWPPTPTWPAPTTTPAPVADPAPGDPATAPLTTTPPTTTPTTPPTTPTTTPPTPSDDDLRSGPATTVVPRVGAAARAATLPAAGAAGAAGATRPVPAPADAPDHADRPHEEVPAQEGTDPGDPHDEADAVTTPVPAAGAAGRADQPGPPTEAGMPIFDDDADEVEWLRARAEAPAPPPPFEEPPERPLFAPGPPDDARTRRGRVDDSSRAGGSGTFWPWDDGHGGHGPGSPVPGSDEPEEDGPVPGRRSLALGVTLIVLILVAVAGVVVWNARQDGSLLGSEDTPGRSASPRDEATPPEPLPVAAVTDLDPQGDPPEEYPELAPLAADGDPATAWNTNTYAQQFGPDGLKTGLGLVVDLGEFRDVAQVRVQVVGQTALAAYVADTEPTGVADLPRLAEGSGDGEVTLTLDSPDTGRFVVVWIDQLPAVSDGFRAEVAEITVLG